MKDPILKTHWERFRAHILLDSKTATTLLPSFLNDEIETLTLLSEGCANSNYKITFKYTHSPIVIRIYVRDHSALKREQAIHQYVADKLPVPHYLYADDSCLRYPHPYALIEWIEGKSLRNIILNGDETAISLCMYETGKYLSVLRNLHFSTGGFFEDNMQVRPFTHDEEYLPFLEMLLNHHAIQESLGSVLYNNVANFIYQHQTILPKKDDANLTHGDYDPANILVKKEKAQWKIASILDWEFAFAGTYLLDIGTMLRYSHKLPACYEKSFIAGIETTGERLPVNWKKQAKLMDLLCLLHLLRFNSPHERPNLNKDAVTLIAHTVKLPIFR